MKDSEVNSSCGENCCSDLVMAAAGRTRKGGRGHCCFSFSVLY